MSVAKIEDLLVDWELARQRGRDLSPEDLAGDAAELIPELRRRIDVLKATLWMMEDAGHEAAGSDVAMAETVGYASLGGTEIRRYSSLRELTTEQFLDALVNSGILTDADVAFLRRLVAEHDPNAGPHKIASRLVEEGLLTAYQSTVLLHRRNSPLQLDRYIVLDEIGAGGMGLVYKALHRPMERVVAIKLLPRHALDSPSKVNRFRREIKAAAKLSHPNIVTAYDAHEVDDTHFLVMEYVPGLDLKKSVQKNGPLEVSRAVTIISQIAEALAEAHRQGIVHRDVKPSNILLSENGVPKLLDLGLARIRALAQQDSSNDLTREGLAMGTAAYMAPEQARSPKHADARADVYSLGCTLYFLIVGRPPFERSSSLETILAHMEAESPTLSVAPKKIPDDLEQVFRRMVAKDPYQRYPHMENVRTALISTGLVDPERVAESARFQARQAQQSLGAHRSWRRWSVAMAVVAVAAVAALLVIPFWPSRPGIDRALAQWALENGGVVWATTPVGTREFRPLEDLPEGRFQIVGLQLRGDEDAPSLESLQLLSELRSLEVSEFPRAAVVAAFEELPPLEELALVSCELRDADMDMLASQQQLKSLDLSANELTDAAMENIGRLSDLERINLSGTAITDYGLKQLPSLPSLRSLWLNDCLITDNGVGQLAALRNTAEELSLEGAQIGDLGLAALPELNKLRRLNLADTRVTLAGLDQLGRLPELSDLRINQFSADGQLRGTLKSLPHLSRLDMSGSDLDDDELLDLAKLPQLTELVVIGTKVTAEGARAFREVRPDCDLLFETAGAADSWQF